MYVCMNVLVHMYIYLKALLSISPYLRSIVIIISKLTIKINILHDTTYLNIC